jgi:hypothetical protein
MGDGGKGSSARPFSVSQEEFAANWEKIFGKKTPREVEDQLLEDEAFAAIGKNSQAKMQCWCYNCNKDKVGNNGLPVTAYTFIVCPECGNKRCPHATDHNLACTNSNESGQPGSRYE